ncbi:hypothetical protein HPB48_017642 [Haemaphysalis longicornis]|uniref:CCHC-type domain-containing protein n=1 Tax=Haemaphysalis longicornis TaxID=44386 RepID=A0A9J6FMQ5_HAELO|nr:hypothetical protein HPB48_017642 [Haemaphysalis longicornis]
MTRQHLDAFSPRGHSPKSITPPGHHLHHTSATTQANVTHVGPPCYSQVAKDFPDDHTSVTKRRPTESAKRCRVVIAFSGGKVPNYVKYGNLLVECSLYRKQIDKCFQCGRLGHRMDVCPNPTNHICRGCGIQNPGKGHNHDCKPKCSLFGGDNLPADKVCKARYKTPYVMRKRRWKRQRSAYEESSRTPQNREETPAEPKSSPPYQERQSRRSLSTGRERRRSNSCSSRPGSRTSSPGADTKQRQIPPSHPSSLSSDCKECSELRKERPELRKLIHNKTNRLKRSWNAWRHATEPRNRKISTKRKVAKRDTHPPELPQEEAMEADRIEPAPSRATHPTIPQQPEPTLQTIMNMLSQISNQQAETNNQVGILTEQMGNLTSRLDNLEAKYNQVSSRMSTFDAKLKHATIVMRKSHKSALHSKPHHETNPAEGNTPQDDEEE